MAKLTLENFDNIKFKYFLDNNNITTQWISNRMGLSEKTVNKYLNYTDSLTNLSIRTLQTMIILSGGKEEDFIGIDRNASPTPEPVVAATVDIQPLIDKIDELITAVNKLGNISMQNMEYIKAIKLNLE